MGNESNVQVRLDPSGYRESVRQFLRFYEIAEKPPCLAFLIEVLTNFSKVPYENISKIIKLHKNYLAPGRLRLPDEVIHDHITAHLGGTCFSLTFTLQTILSELDFLCYPVIAHMTNRPNSHCALVVLLAGKKYLADPGYLLNHPMEIHPNTPRFYHTEHTGVELAFNRQDESYNVLTFDRTQVKWRYKFSDKPLSTNEFLQFWLDSFYWAGMRSLCLTQVRSDGMVYVHNDFVQVQNLRGKQKGRVEDIHQLVRETFHIAPEWVERAQAAIPEIVILGQQHGFYRKQESRE